MVRNESLRTINILYIITFFFQIIRRVISHFYQWNSVEYNVSSCKEILME